MLIRLKLVCCTDVVMISSAIIWLAKPEINTTCGLKIEYPIKRLSLQLEKSTSWII